MKPVQRHVLKAFFEACYRVNYDVLKANNRSSGGPEGPELSHGHAFMVLRALDLSGRPGPAWASWAKPLFPGRFANHRCMDHVLSLSSSICIVHL